MVTVIGWLVVAGLIAYGLFQGGSRPPRLSAIARVRRGDWVRVSGRIADGGVLVAPITGRACVCFDAVVARARGPGQLEVVLRAVRGTPFVIDDGTGKALVDPRGAYVRVVYDHSLREGELDDGDIADPEFAAELAGADPAGLRFEEGVLAVGETVVVEGLVAHGAGDDPVYRRLADTQVRLAGGPDRAAVVSERPEDLVSEGD